MKCLTISQPYASLIASGEKWIENRRWYCGYRGRLAIHAGKGTQYLTAHELKKYPTGLIVAVAEMVGCVHLASLRQGGELCALMRLAQLGFTRDRILQHAHVEGPFCFVLANVVKLPEPIAAVGCLGLFDVPDIEVQP